MKTKFHLIGKEVNKIKIVEDSLLNATEDIIIHQVNCQGVMGSGLAKQIRNKYPEVYKHYQQTCNTYQPYDLLGKVLFIECHDGKIVANVFGQLDYGRGGQYTDYIALQQGLEIVVERAKQYKESVAIPFGIGCGLGGADWNIVFSMICSVFQEYDNVNIYKLT